MHIILTHEQADFDALASMLGAYLLNEHTIPVLPRRMNRNVKAYLTLYGLELPFVDPRDLHVQPIDYVTLVDTQSMVSVKGMTSNTSVYVVDHHPLREGLPESWSVTQSDTGATTTLFVETLQEHDRDLTTVQSTLLLLGIYEDTGSLTYSRTTPRDLQAAAFLLEHGASLRLATDFLNHPLSQAQQELYDELRASAMNLHVHGHSIILAYGEAHSLEEELSSIVHKLRDLLDPDALFVLVKTRGGIQMIARSNSDNIDVAAVLANFGGGGHERAAACLIRNQDLESLKAGLIEVLPEHIRPAIIVAQIMSRDPKLLAPSTPVEEIAHLMQRYGYEGFPVAQGGKVLGLVTRRAVDRALSHKLHMPASSLMEAGEYTILPDDSVEHLQRLMTDSGWGQIPVVDPASKSVVGIVTRTDLLKTLTPQAKLPSTQNQADRLEAALDPSRLALIKAISQTAFDQHAALYLVGGFVRDLLLNRPSLDFDLVVEGDAIKLAQALSGQYGGRVTSHARFGTAKWHLPQPFNWSDQPYTMPDLPVVDLVTARIEFYTHPTALPTVERGSIKLDLHRRDFTINTLALRLDGYHYGDLYDYWGGLHDIKHGYIRVLHSLSFVDDPTRMLRAVRFEQRFGFRLEQRTLVLLNEALSLLGRVSGDRIRHELNNILIEECSGDILARLHELNLLCTIHPTLGWDDWLYERFRSLPDTIPDPDWEIPDNNDARSWRQLISYTIWLLRNLPERAVAVCDRLKMPVQLRSTVQAASQLWHTMPWLAKATPSELVSNLKDLPALSRYAVYLATENPRQKDILLTYAKSWRHIKPSVTGHELRKLGIPPGPVYRTILSALRNARLDGSVSTDDQEIALLKELIKSPEVRSQDNGSN